MKNIFTIFNREIKAYFNSPIAYIFIIVFVLISAGLFMTSFFLLSTADMRMFFLYLPIILCVFLPAVTMRLWSEDRKGNTLELLLTFPAHTHELVLGKFLAGVVFYIVSLIATLPIPVMLAVLGNPDMGVIFCQYTGAVFLGCFFLALGIFVSGFCEDQIVAFIVAMMACFGLYLLGLDFTVSSIDGWIPGFGSFLRSAFGTAGHFTALEKGVIDSRDILYFIAGTTIFLILNGFWLDTRLRPKAKTVFVFACAICAGIFMLFNIIFTDISLGRYDLTEGRIYTVSGAARDILQGLKAPVMVKLFISPRDKMPTSFKTLERDIRDKLEELKVASGSKLGYKVFHMEAANAAGEDENALEKSIEKKGIMPFRVQSVEADEVGVKAIYSAISIAYKEKPEEIIPRITPKNLMDLEYMLVSKIYKMTLDKIPEVALVAPYEEKAVDPRMKELLESMGQQAQGKFREDEYELLPKLLEYEGYKVSRIRLTEEEPIPEEADTLIVIEPRQLNDRQRYEINSFLVSGGSVFLAAQEYVFAYSTSGRGGFRFAPRKTEPGVNPLLEDWGLGLSKDILMDTQIDIVSLTGSGRFLGIFEMSSPVKLPVQIRVIDDQMNKDISITTNLPSIFYLWGSALTITEDKLGQFGLDYLTLFTSSDDSWQTNYHAGDFTNQDITPPAASERQAYPLALLAGGQFPDAFKGEDIPDWPMEEAEDESYEREEPAADISPEPGKLILVGCSEMFKNQMIKNPGQSGFFINSIDAITLGDDIIKVRSRAPAARFIKKLSSGAKAGWRIFVTFLIPVIIAAIGILRIVIRKRAKQVYLRNI